MKKITFLLIRKFFIIIVLILIFSNARAQHFSFEGGNPADPVWTLYFSGATFDGQNLVSGDEIAVFDGSKMVGAFVLDKICTPENAFSNDLSAFKTLTNGPGWVSGNAVSFKCWDASTGIESSVCTPTYTDPYNDPWCWTQNIFPPGDGYYSVVSVAFITQNIPVTGITVNPHSLGLTTGETGQLTATVIPSNATNQNVTWSSDHNEIASVDNNGLVTAIGAGTATIKATTVDGGFKDSCMVTVSPLIIPVTGVTVSPHALTIYVGQTGQVTATVVPANATNKNVTWYSQNSSIANVNTTGLVTAIAQGVAKVWVKTEDGNFTDTCTVTVANPPAPVLVSATPGIGQITLTWTPIQQTKNPGRTTHFNFEGGNPADPVYTLYMFGAKLDGADLVAGDEIGVYDGAKLVGSIVLSSVCSVDNYSNAIPAFKTLTNGPGYVPGHAVSFRCWDASLNLEISNFQVSYMNLYDGWTQNVFPDGDGIFSFPVVEFTSYVPTFNVYYTDGTLRASNITGNTYTDTGLSNGTQYCYYIKQIMADGSLSAPSNSLCATTLNPLPGPAGTISGLTTVCQGQQGVAYSVSPITNATGYVWTLPAGATIATGSNTNSITVNYSNTAVSGNISVYGTNSYGNGTPSSLTITVNPLPSAAGTITGTSTVCQGQQGVAYSVGTITGATGYVWTLPTGATIATGSNTNSITVNYSNTAVSGDITVYGTNTCGNGTISPAFAVTVNSVPSATGTITGTSTVCQGQQGLAYSVGTITGATGYVWTLPSGATIATGSNTNAITVNYSNTAISGDITVYGTNNCGNGTVSPAFAVTVNSVPSVAGTITGTSTICQGQQGVVYSVSPITNATGYVWTLPSGATIATGNNTNAITVNYSNTAISGDITVYGTNTCGNGTISPAFAVTVNSVPSAAGTITGTSTICQGQQGVVYSVSPITNATGYVWTLPSGATIATGNNTNAITVNYSNTAISGDITVYGTNTCGNGTISPAFAVTVNSVPSAAGTITGTSTICQGQQGVVYSVSPITNATGYVWTLPSGATIATGNNTNAITVNYSNTAISGNITVYGTNTCGNGTISPAFAVTVNSVPSTAGTITGTSTICQGQQGVAYSVGTITGATGYVWTLPSGATIATGSNTNAITVNYSNTAISGNITVYGTNSCGNGTISPAFAVTVNSVPSAAGTITGTSTVCQGQQGVTYSVGTITGATGYVWTLPAGATIATGSNTNAITVNYSNTAISGNITVYGTNSCGNGTVSPAFAVTVNSVPAVAGTISGLTTVYQRQNRIAYSVPLIENATGYVWTLPTGATIESGDNTNSITVSFSASSVSGNISVYGTNSCGNGTSSSQAITVVPSHFAFTGGNASDPTYTIYLPSALLDAVDLQFGDEISVFDGTTMVGAFTLSEVLTPANQLANAMVAFSTLNTGSGYVAGDPVTFKCFDVSAGVEISNFEAAYGDPFGGAWTQPYFPSADAEYSFASLNFHSFLTQSINLNVAGFQYVSSYLVPQNPNMKTICTNILNNLDYVKNNAGLMLRKIGPNWVNGIGNWNPVESYVFKMKGQATLNIYGFKIDPLTQFNFVTGFQFVSYIHDYPMDAKVAFTSILSKLNYVKNTAGLMLRKIGPNWVNGIGNLKPGEGYIVNMKNASTFTYPLADLTKANNEFMASQHFIFEGGDAASPVYTVYIADAEVNGVDLQVGDEIGVFDGETLVGSLVLTQVPTAENQFENAIPIFTVLNSGTGYQPGNQISFRIWKASKNLEYEHAAFDFSNPYGDAHTSAIFPDDDAAYSIASLKVSATDIIDYNKPVFITSAFPNPFSQHTTIEYTLRDNAMVTLLLYNSVGQKVKTLSDSRELQGKHTIELDGTTLQPGVYYLRLEAITNSDKLTDLRKIVLVK